MRATAQQYVALQSRAGEKSLAVTAPTTALAAIAARGSRLLISALTFASCSGPGVGVGGGVVWWSPWHQGNPGAV